MNPDQLRISHDLTPCVQRTQCERCTHERQGPSSRPHLPVGHHFIRGVRHRIVASSSASTLSPPETGVLHHQNGHQRRRAASAENAAGPTRPRIRSRSRPASLRPPGWPGWVTGGQRQALHTAAVGTGRADLVVMGPKATKPPRTRRNARERSRTHRASGGPADAPASAHNGQGGQVGHPDQATTRKQRASAQAGLCASTGIPIAADSRTTAGGLSDVLAATGVNGRWDLPRRRTPPPVLGVTADTKSRGRGDDTPAVAALFDCPPVSLRRCVRGRVGGAFECVCPGLWSAWGRGPVSDVAWECRRVVRAGLLAV